MPSFFFDDDDAQQQQQTTWGFRMGNSKKITVRWLLSPKFSFPGGAHNTIITSYCVDGIKTSKINEKEKKKIQFFEQYQTAKETIQT